MADDIEPAEAGLTTVPEPIARYECPDCGARYFQDPADYADHYRRAHIAWRRDHLSRAGWPTAGALRAHLMEVHSRGTTRPSWERLLRYHAEEHGG